PKAFGLWLCSIAALWAAEPRVVSLTAPATETMYALGAQRLVVGVTASSVFPEQVRKDREAGRVREIGQFGNPDRVVLQELRPTLILTGTSFQRRLAEELRRDGYRVLHCEPRSIEEVWQDIERIGAAVGKAREARRLTAGLRQQMRTLAAQTALLAPRRVYIEMNHEGPWTSGRGNPIEDLLAAAGGKNIFGDDERSVFQTSHAEIIRRQPEVILSPIWVEAKMGGLDGLVALGEIFRRPGYEATPAWKNSEIHYYDSALLKHTGPRQALAARKLAQLLHPLRFPAPEDSLPWEFGRIRP
ncbi:helical backbone metal receptor, partial [Nostoc sp. NIES-2111]